MSQRKKQKGQERMAASVSYSAGDADDAAASGPESEAAAPSSPVESGGIRAPGLLTVPSDSRAASPAAGASSSAYLSPRSIHDAELDAARSRIAFLEDAVRHHEQFGRDLVFLSKKGAAIKAEFNERIDSLVQDVQALSDHAVRQEQLGTVGFTPARSRTPSIENDHKNASSSSHRNNAASSSHGKPERLKEFGWRDSQLTTMFRTSSDIKTIYNMFVSVLILFAIKVLVNDTLTVREHSISETSLAMITWTFGKIHLVIACWWMMFFVHCSIVPIMWIWRRKFMGDKVYSALYLLHQAAFFWVFFRIIVWLELPVASSLILLCEQVRMLMKCHSFWRETLRIKHSPLETPRGVSTHLSNSLENTTLLNNFGAQARAFLYFHFVPTLIYRQSYPRCRYIRWKFVFACALECIGATFYIYIIFANFCVPEFKNTATDPGNPKMLFVSLFNSVLPGIMVYLLTFFGLLHSWMNMFAELCRFADRCFYADWWATTSFSSYYRKWNQIVHDSLYNYIYVDLVRLGCPKGVCFFLTFLMSAVVHEYIISVSLGFFYPVLLVMFLFFGVAFVYLTRFVGTSGQAWNVFFWTNLIIGNGILLIMYSREYYARQPLLLGAATPKFEFDSTTWMPYSWQPFLLANGQAH